MIRRRHSAHLRSLNFSLSFLAPSDSANGWSAPRNHTVGIVQGALCGLPTLFAAAATSLVATVSPFRTGAAAALVFFTCGYMQRTCHILPTGPLICLIMASLPPVMSYGPHSLLVSSHIHRRISYSSKRPSILRIRVICFFQVSLPSQRRRLCAPYCLMRMYSVCAEYDEAAAAAAAPETEPTWRGGIGAFGGR